jgi:uncharacterized protein YabN with tetrapyrrole methylase and pyrophosphatase domain
MEEAYEVREAVLEGDDAELARELGDLALHVAFQSVLAEERGAFDAKSVFRAVLEKMVRRHPHVFGPGATWPVVAPLPLDGPAGAAPHAGTPGAEGVDGPDVGACAPADRASGTAAAPAPAAGDVPLQWEEIKRRERSGQTAPGRLLEGIPRALPALLAAQRVQERVASVGFDWPDVAGALGKLREEVDELSRELSCASADHARVAAEMGDVLFAAVNVARKAGLVAEDALTRATARFRGRFEAVEDRAAERGLDLATAGLEALDALWEETKRGERQS